MRLCSCAPCSSSPYSSIPAADIHLRKLVEVGYPTLQKNPIAGSPLAGRVGRHGTANCTAITGGRAGRARGEAQIQKPDLSRRDPYQVESLRTVLVVKGQSGWVLFPAHKQGLADSRFPDRINISGIPQTRIPERLLSADCATARIRSGGLGGIGEPVQPVSPPR